MHNKLDFTIDIALQENCCTIISQSGNYIRDEFGITKQGAPRSTEHVQKFQQKISARMQKLYADRIADILNEKPAILHIDCGAKEDKDILFFVIEQYALQKTENNVVILKALQRHSIIGEPGYWQQYAQKNPSASTQNILDHYLDLFKTEEENTDSREMTLGFEYDWIVYAISKILDQQNQKYLYLYLDNIGNLSTHEQARINNILYTRGSIYENKSIRLKINNGHGDRKTISTNTGQRVQSTHDYSETSIKEKDIE